MSVVKEGCGWESDGSISGLDERTSTIDHDVSV